MRNGFIKLTLIVAVLLCASVVFGSLLLTNVENNVGMAANALTYDVFRGEFISSVNESGEIESSSNVEVRCNVKSKGRGGTTILSLIPEGTMVEKGDFLGQLDDSVLQEQLTEQKINVAQDSADAIQAESDLDTAKRVLDEFLNGTFEQDRAELEAEVALAKETARRAREYKKYSEGLNRKGYITRTQLEADSYAEEKADLDLKLALQKLLVFEKFTRERMVAEFEAEIRKQEANVAATEYTLELSNLKQAEFEDQVASCRVVAPSAGMVVYANETDRRGDASFVIEEGAILRDGQVIFRLPDPTKMQVRTKVNDSKINQISPGMKAVVRVDTSPETPIAAVVRKVNAFPEPRRWFQAPIEYEVFVDVLEESPLIRSGLRGKVEIFIERIENVVQAPVSSLVRKDDLFYVFVKDKKHRIEPRLVEIGSNNEKFVIVKSGLEVGEQVLVDADNYIDEVVFPTAS